MTTSDNAQGGCGDAHLCRRMSGLLPERPEIHVQPINDPAVARGQRRLRIMPAPFHTKDPIPSLASGLVAARAGLDPWADVRPPRGQPVFARGSVKERPGIFAFPLRVATRCRPNEISAHQD